MGLSTEDLAHLQQVAGLYVHVIDAKQWDRLDELYTADGVFDLTGLVGAEMRYEGIDAIKGFLTSMPMPLAHVSTNHTFFAVGDEVHGRGKWFTPGEDGTVSGGVYRDRFTKTAAGWRLQERLVFGWAGAEEQ
jgi:SnoaL-like domain